MRMQIRIRPSLFSHAFACNYGSPAHDGFMAQVSEIPKQMGPRNAKQKKESF